ncbi:hypothetical protein [Nocardia blacklockiae]|uniref:hypothetical protein n=1 Tax=Nocardia blacklockiae TaxID=480036 RepID=UPI0018942D84|nr:hypothetical protein [Nocardia blacklockiae]MBF6175620.1 hypothetical protein [Nocardia blacklockiae]
MTTSHTAHKLVATAMITAALAVGPAALAPQAFAAPGGSSSGHSDSHSESRSGGTHSSHDANTNGTGTGRAGGNDATARAGYPKHPSDPATQLRPGLADSVDGTANAVFERQYYGWFAPRADAAPQSQAEDSAGSHGCVADAAARCGSSR